MRTNAYQQEKENQGNPTKGEERKTTASQADRVESKNGQTRGMSHRTGTNLISYKEKQIRVEKQT